MLKKNNIYNYNLDSELLLANTLNTTREKVLLNLQSKISIDDFHYFKKLILRRYKKEPVAYILKKKEFWKNLFFVNKNVLIPRPETELIVDEILSITEITSRKKILDIGTGTGCIIISIIKERPNFYATAIDICKKALNIAKYNAKMHQLLNKIKFVNIDVDKFHYNKYDFIVSNPPYIKKFDLKRLNTDVKNFEPNIALEAGIDGFNNIKKLIKKSKKLLKMNGKLVFEVGEKQGNYTKYLLNKNGFYINKIRQDLQSMPRVIISTKLS
jgi:protein-(glutamine-N5) methyltransferase, release factor-specific